MAQSVSEWRALVVNEVDENDLLQGATQRDETGRDLPTRMVKLPVDDLSQIAVLSWRWDGENLAQGSRNVLAAIRQAKKIGIQYLFIDVVSIDQHLHEEELLKQVTAFSMLYKTIPVIAAYDTIGGGYFRSVMERPWILSEVRLFRYNPTRIIYVGHQTDQGKNHFNNLLERLWSSGFVNTILGVLCGKIGMYDISDFKYIIPPLASVLTVAYGKMTRNDYLLTTAIICQAHHHVLWQKDTMDDGEPHHIIYEKFDRYTLSDSASYDPTINGGTLDQDVFLDGTRIAIWRHKWNRYMEIHKVSLMAFSNAEQIIFTALDLSESDYREYASQEEMRSASLRINTDAPPPEVEIAFIEL